MSTAAHRLIDIGSNLGDPVFRGHYHGKQSHPDDFEAILNRARTAGVQVQLLTGDSIPGSTDVLNLASKYEGLFATVGCHPCRATEMEKFPGGIEAYVEQLDEIIRTHSGPNGKVLAVGECGLDYDRLFLAPKESQLRTFPPQLALATKHDLPLFLHSRNCHEDFISILQNHPTQLRGVVHSFTGTLEEANELISLGLYIGINGCSLKTEDNLQVVQHLPLERIMVESDCPWCEIRPSHASSKFLQDLPSELKDKWCIPQVKKEKFVEGKGVKGRNEPAGTGLVAWVISRLKGVTIEQVAQVTTRNAIALFGPKLESPEPRPE
ncbi:3'-5'-exodeoxyribonuclease [Sporobolomyces koalae]|uniref:3'-5'-exodeoxyribonuclease n=1 Tax=Sporobolomyces koalae TaxID=500713 RepID=UPI00317D34FF